MDYRRTLKLRFYVETGTCQKEERGSSKYVTRGVEEEGAQSCPCGNSDESRTHIGGDGELHKETRNVVEKRRIHWMRHGEVWYIK